MSAAKNGKRRSWAKRLLVALFLFFTVPIALAAIARTEPVREYARQEAERAIRAELGLSAVIGDVNIDTKSWAIVASGITLDHPEHGRLVEAKVLRIRPSWWALLRGKVDLHTITIDKATLWLVIRDGKLINGPNTKPSSSGGQSVDLPFNKLFVKRSRLVVDAAPDAHGELSAIEVFLDSTEREVLGITLSSPSGWVKHRTGKDVLKKLVAHARLTDENVQLDLLRVATPELSVALRDSAAEFPLGSSYRGNFDVRVHLPQLLQWPLPVTLPHLEGDVRVAGNVTGDKDSGIRGSAQLSLRRVVLDQYGFGDDVEMAVTLDKKLIKFDGNAALIRNGGSVDLSGSLSLDKSLPLRVKAHVNEVEFCKLMEQLGVSPNAIVDWKLAGAFELNGTLDPLSLEGPLRMPTRDFRVLRDAWHVSPARNVIAVQSASLVGSVSVKPKGITLQDIDATLHNSKLHVHEVLLGFDNQLRIRANAELLDLQDVTPLVDFELAGKGGFDLTVDGTFTEPRVSGNMHFDDFAFASYPFGNVASDFHLEKDVQAVRFPHLVAQKRDSRYSADDFLLDFSDHKLAIEAKLHLERMALADFYHIFHYEDDERYESYQGVVNGDAQVSYTLGFPQDSPHGTMLATMDLNVNEAVLSGFHFQGGHFNGSWSWFDHTQGYRGGELDVERFSLRKGTGTINVSGKMVAGGKLDMVVAADKIAIRDTEGLSERMPQLTGSYAITGTVKGEASTPLAELDVMGTGLSYAGNLLGDARTYVRLTSKEDPWVKEALAWKESAPPEGASCGHAREGLARSSW
ncbi:MAG TPA: hypothetical protein VHM19_16675, partial [Polyangiales bacterium]|nr:hypothetical protein [Polyangiales bacterium]